MARKFFEMVGQRWKDGARVCVGLDPDRDKIPARIMGSKSAASPLFAINRETIDATKDTALCYKPNLGFYTGPEGLNALRNTVVYIRDVAKGVPIILDAKYGDIGNTNKGYVNFAFDWLKCDAVTVHNYMGHEAMKPFLERSDKGILVLCKTSNPGSGEFQNCVLDGKILTFHNVALHVADRWNYNSNCGLVVGATYPNDLAEVRKIAYDMPILIPGIGTQGGDVLASVKAGVNSKKSGIIINSSSGIMFSVNPNLEMGILTNSINDALAQV